MGIDFQITAHLDQQVVTNLLLSILERREFFAEIQTAMASFSLVGHELASDLLAPGELAYPALEFRTLHSYHVRTLLSDGQEVRRQDAGWRGRPGGAGKVVRARSPQLTREATGGRPEESFQRVLGCPRWTSPQIDQQVLGIS